MIRTIRCWILKHQWKYFPKNKGRICTRCGKEQSVKDGKYVTNINDPLGTYL